MKYDKKSDTSFCIGMFATIELLNSQPENIVGIYFSSKIKMNDKVNEIFGLCKKMSIPLIERTKFVENIAGKENVFIVAEFKKTVRKLKDGNHVVLVNPSDMGNMGTI